MTAAQSAPLTPDTPDPVVTEGDVRALRELLAAATPGPWKYPHRNYPGVVMSRSGCLWVPGSKDRHDSGHINHEPDAALIAASVNALPALLDALDAARERVRVVEGEREDWDRLCDLADAYLARAESAEAARAATIAGVRAWCAINEIAEPPLDWAGLGEFLDRALLGGGAS